MEFHDLEIARVIQETPDARSYELHVPEPLAERFRYRPGQFLTFEVPLGETRLIRCYSLSSTPGLDPLPRVTVKRIEEGRVSNWMNDRLVEGQRIRVMAPAGRFVLRASEAPLLLFGGGSGITPLLSILKAALADTQRRVRLVYANRDRDSVIFDAVLAELAKAHAGRFELHHHLDSEKGFLAPVAARDHVIGFADADCYVCGPGPFMDVVESALRESGVPEDRVWIERFVSPADGEAPEVALSKEEAAAAPSRITLSLDGETREIDYDPGKTVLEAAQAAGMDPPFACTEGYCGSCAGRVEEGRVVMTANDVFTQDEVARGHVLTCQARVVGGPCRIRYED
ncbi:MAG: ferredoxin--NADP reductase [Myxococcota bacterium]|nr:ferredoxin--NADP reductase [Myxococcota bacterium]